MPVASIGRFVLDRGGPVAWWRENPDYARRHFPTGWLPESAPMRLAQPKPPGTFRVVVLGESAAYGYPDPAFGLPRMLAAHLEARHPDRTVEVVNAALAGVNSHALLDMTPDALALEPDALVIYAGNNEYVGPYGPCNPGPEPPSLARIRFKAWLSRFELPRRLSAARSPAASDTAPMAARPVAIDDPALAEVARRFAANLAAIADRAVARGVPVILSTVPVNERDWAPFGADDLKTNAVYAEGASTADDEPGKARQAWMEALRRDPLRYRTTPELNAATRAVAEARPGKVLLAECRDRLAAESPDGAPGNEFFYDHCHLRPEGAHRVAGWIAERLAEILPDAADAAEMPLDAALARLGWSPWHAGANLRYVLHLAAKPPYVGRMNHEAWTAGLEREAAEADRAMADSAAAFDALQAMRERHPGDIFLQRNVAQWLDARGDPASALPHWVAISRDYPAYPVGWIGLARGLRDTGNPDGAAHAFAQACALRPDRADWRREQAACLQAVGAHANAIALLRTLADASPRDPLAWRALADAHAQAGDHAGVVAAYREGLVHLPEQPSMHYYHVKALADAGDPDAAREALRAAPPDPALAPLAESLGLPWPNSNLEDPPRRD